MVESAMQQLVSTIKTHIKTWTPNDQAVIINAIMNDWKQNNWGESELIECEA